LISESDCEKPCKARESLPDILESIRRAKRHASYLDDQLIRLERAYGDSRPESPKGDPEELPLVDLVEHEATELADFLLTLQEAFGRRLNTLFGDRV